MDDTLSAEDLLNEQSPQLILESTQDHRTIFLAGEQLQAGRRSTCHLVLPDNSISRVHFTMQQVDGQWYIVDSSSNGTMLDGTHLIKNQYTPLPDGACICIPTIMNDHGQYIFEWIVHTADTASPLEDLYLGRYWYSLSQMAAGQNSFPLADFLFSKNLVLLLDPAIEILKNRGRWIVNAAEDQPVNNGSIITLPDGVRLYFGKNSRQKIRADMTDTNTLFSDLRDAPTNPPYLERLKALIASGNIYIPITRQPIPAGTDSPYRSGRRIPYMSPTPGMSTHSVYPVCYQFGNDAPPVLLAFMDPKLPMETLPDCKVAIISGEQLLEWVFSEVQIAYLYCNDVHSFYVLRPDTFEAGRHDEPITAWNPDILHQKIRSLFHGSILVRTNYPPQLFDETATLRCCDKGSKLFTASFDLHPGMLEVEGFSGADDLCRFYQALQFPQLLPIVDLQADASCIVSLHPFYKWPTLESQVRSLGALDEEQVRQVIRQLLSLMEYLQKQNPSLLLLDLHPSNFQINTRGQIVYTGLSTLNDLVRMIKRKPGKLRYSIPDGMTGAYDIRSSVYALGMLAAFMITGEEPDVLFERYGQQIKFKDCGVELSAQLRNFIHRCLRALETTRYDSIEEARDALFGESA